MTVNITGAGAAPRRISRRRRHNVWRSLCRNMLRTVQRA